MAKSKEKIDLVETYAQSRILVFGQSVIYTLIVIAIFGLLGYFLDQQLGTYPKLMIAGIVISYPFTQYVLIKKVKKLAKDTQDKVNKGKNG